MAKQKVIVVTGGSSGIGLQTIRQLAADGLNMIISFSRSADKIRKALAELDGKENIEFVSGDVSDPTDCWMLADQIYDKYGVLHGLVNNAGVLTKGGIEMVDYESWRYNLDVNLNGVYLLTQTLLPLLRKANGASIVNVSSIASMKPGSSIAYSVSKAGLDMLTEFLAGDLGAYKIRVNSVNPGLVRTPIHLANKVIKSKGDYERMLEDSVSRYPIGRIGDPEDVTNLIEFLLSDKASWITGSIFKIDGGAMVYNDLIPPKEV
jgi:NAD(P)-dependent dehydrogenase (short-subunit alcohol dehydrogenase family)